MWVRRFLVPIEITDTGETIAMARFAEIIETMTAVSVFLFIVMTYLRINKIWGRKHDRTVVESVSVVAMMIVFATNLPFFIKFAFIDGTMMPALMQGVGM